MSADNHRPRRSARTQKKVHYQPDDTDESSSDAEEPAISTSDPDESNNKKPAGTRARRSGGKDDDDDISMPDVDAQPPSDSESEDSPEPIGDAHRTMKSKPGTMNQGDRTATQRNRKLASAAPTEEQQEWAEDIEAAPYTEENIKALQAEGHIPGFFTPHLYKKYYKDKKGPFAEKADMTGDAVDTVNAKGG